MDLAPENANGPYFWKILKSGQVRYVENPPKGKHIVEYLERIDFLGQDKMHYLTLMSKDHQKLFFCDFRSVCGYDRGPRFKNLLTRMWKKGD